MSSARVFIARLIVHAAVITAVTAFVVTAVGQNIAMGMAMIVLLALGLPWSLVLIPFPLTDRGAFAVTAVYLTLAMGNLLLHGLFALWVTRGQRAQPSGTERD